MSEASRDVVHDILSRLPAKTLLRLRCVCKAWKSIIDDPIFVKSHTKSHQSSSSTILVRNRCGSALLCLSLDSLNYAADGYKELDLIYLKQIIHRDVPRLSRLPSPSCNGLILIPHNNINKSWAIWNPLLQDFHLLPPPPPLSETDLKGRNGCELVRYGFGYDEGSDDYKVVRVDKFCGKRVNDHDNYTTRVYSLKSRLWRTIDFPGGDCLGRCGAFVDGALHWRSRYGMVALDLGKEVHRLVAPPPPPPPPKYEWLYWESLDALDGCLIWSYSHENLMGIDAWVMEDYGTEKSWTKLFSIPTQGRCMEPVVAYLKSKGQVFLRHRGSDLKWLHLERKSWRYIMTNGVLHSRYELCFLQFSPSLVRLDNHKNRRRGLKRKQEKAFVSSGERPCILRTSCAL